MDFVSLENNTIVYYKNSNYYYPNEQSGIIWNDPILNIKWPVNKPVMSIKDKLNFNFSEFLINQKIFMKKIFYAKASYGKKRNKCCFKRIKKTVNTNGWYKC